MAFSYCADFVVEMAMLKASPGGLGWGGGGACLVPSAFFVQGYCLIMIENC